MFEKVVASRLIYYLELNHLGEPLQSAYQLFHNCETAFVLIHNGLLRAVDNRCCVVLLLLDLSTAFDSVDHNLLLSRLESKFLIRGKALQWFISYLSQRSQFDCIYRPGYILFSWIELWQTPRPSPVLYLLYTSPVADILRHHNMAFHLYAYDTQLYACMLFFLISNISNIKKCLNDKPSWMTANKLKQAKLIYFHSKYSPQKSFITLHFGADLIQPSQLVRDIGANLTVLFLWYLRLIPTVSQLSIKCGTLLALGSVYLPRPRSWLSTPLSPRS